MTTTAIAAAKFFAARRRAERAAGRHILTAVEAGCEVPPTNLDLDARSLVALCGASRARISAALTKMPLS